MAMMPEAGTIARDSVMHKIERIDEQIHMATERLQRILGAIEGPRPEDAAKQIPAPNSLNAKLEFLHNSLSAMSGIIDRIEKNLLS